MAKTRHRNGEGQLELPDFAPVGHWQTIPIQQPNGDVLMKRGKFVIESDDIGTRKAAKILGLSQRRVQEMCETELLECSRPGGGPCRKGNYKIKLASVMARKERSES